MRLLFVLLCSLAMGCVPSLGFCVEGEGCVDGSVPIDSLPSDAADADFADASFSDGSMADGPLPDTTVDVDPLAQCQIDQRVVGGACVPCGPGSTNDAGDDTSGGDTLCAPVLCRENERVMGHRCVACPTGATKPAGDEASGNDTQCDDGSCFAVFSVPCSVFNEAYVKASNTSAVFNTTQHFGSSIAVSSDGSTIAVGAPGEGSSSTGINGNQSGLDASGLPDSPGAGAVYVFRRNSGVWIQEAYVKASNTDLGDLFGTSIALSADGNVLAVGAIGEDSAATGVGGEQSTQDAPGSGAVYVYRRDAGVWSHQAYVKASNSGRDDNFGTSVALSADGLTLAVGATNESSWATGVNGYEGSDNRGGSGAVYVFRYDDIWAQEAYVKASNTTEDSHFGGRITLSLDGNTMAVGAEDEGSSARGVGGDETQRPSSQGSGAVYVFRRSGTFWFQDAYIKASNTGTNDNFGVSLALSSDGFTLAVGADTERSVGQGVDADQASNGATASGAVYVFRHNGTWAQEAYIKASNSGSFDNFGSSVSLTTDGSILAVGAWGEWSSATGLGGDQASSAARRSGAVYLFQRNGITWSQDAYLKASNTNALDRFGTTAKLSSDGTTLAVGAPREDSEATGIDGDQLSNAAVDSGAVYIRRIAP